MPESKRPREVLNFSPQQTRHILELMVSHANNFHAIAPDVIYLYNHQAEPMQPYEVFGQMWVDGAPESHPPSRVSGRGNGRRKETHIRLVRTKSSYSTVAYLIARHQAKTVCQYLDPAAGDIYTSDGALRRAITNDNLIALHFEIQVGSRWTLDTSQR